MRKTVLLVLAAMLLASPVAAQSFDDAIRAANTKAREARSMADAGRLEDADRMYAEAVGMLPADTPDHDLRGLRYARVKIHMQWGEVQLTRGRDAEARQLFARALDATEDDKGLVADVVNDIGLAEWQQGHLDEAARRFESARRVYEETGQEWGRAIASGNLGLVALDRATVGGPPSLLDEAERHFLDAKAVFEKRGDKRNLANQWSNLGLALRRKGDLAKAEQAHQEGLKLDRELGNPVGEVDSLANLGRVRESAKDLPKAADFYKQAFALAKEVGYVRGISHNGLYLLDVLDRQGRYAEAKPYGVEAAEAAGRIGNKMTLARIHEELAVNAGGLCRFSEAAEHYRREAAFRRQAGDGKKAEAAEFNASMVAGRKDGQGVLCP